MKYVNTPITSVNACPQPGFAERELPDDHPEIVEFERRANGELTAGERADRDMASSVMQIAIATTNMSATAQGQVRAALRQAYAGAQGVSAKMLEPKE